MAKTKVFVLVAVLCLCQSLNAKDEEIFPKKITVSDYSLYKVGQGKRKYYWANVYDAALYIDAQSQKEKLDADYVINNAKVSAIRTRYNHSVDLKSVKNAWQESIQKNCFKWCKNIESSQELFMNKLEAIEKQDTHDYLFLKTGLTILKNKKPWINIQDQFFAKIILLTFIGEHPPTKKLKQSLLGQ